MTRAFSIYLDLVRFIAACLVVIYHSSSPFLVDRQLPLSGYGHTAVILFFVLSGYVIAYATDTREQTARDYALSRFSRIWSLAAPAILLTPLLDLAGEALEPGIYAGHTTHDHALLRIASSFLFLNEVWAVSIMTFSNTAYWSLNYEAWYYVLFAVYMFGDRSRRWWWIGLVALLLGPKVVLLAPVWLLGVLLYRWQRPQQIPEWLGWALLAGSIGLFVAMEQAHVSDQLAAALQEHMGARWWRELNFSRWFLGDYVLGLVVFLNFTGMRRVAFRFAPLLDAIERPVRIGAAYTFSIYILHQPLLYFFSALIGLPQTGLLKFWAVMPCVALTVFVIGHQTERKRGALRRWLAAAADWARLRFGARFARGISGATVRGIFRRLAVELRNRGPAGFARFIALRLVQWRGDVLYEHELGALGADPAAVRAVIVVIDRNNFRSPATAAVEDSVLTGGNHVYVDELQGNATLLAATAPDGAVASYAFIVFESFYKRVLGEAYATPIICNCVTLPPYRGQGLYPELLQAACRHLAKQGHARVIVTCAPDNAASIRGIEKAGFRKVKTLHSLILFTRWIVRQRAAPGQGAPLA